ncbi:MAG: FHA domain-containing protein [Cellulomonadaceae bacterium]|nr:FHA domain-containing protein [Cellulomonadaceae bacterium]
MSTTTGNPATGQHEHVAQWPRINAAIDPDGRGTLNINGTERPCVAASVDELRTGVIARCAQIAAQLHRPVRLTVTDGASTWAMAVRAEGIVQLLEDDSTIPPADGLAAHEGRCRICRRLQPVTQAHCVQCGIPEPHRVETVGFGTGDVEADEHSPAGAQAERPRLQLTFSTQASVVEATEGVALGRNPDPVGGRRPIQVVSHELQLSRTHALIDIDDTGRILVTDHHSGNGIEAQTNPPMRLTPGRPHIVQPGTTLLMGDVAVLVDFA